VDDAREAALPSGLTVKVEIAHQESDGVRVPVSALVDGRGHDAVVYALAGDRARRVPVVVRQLLGDDALLVSPLIGIDSVVSTGASLLSDGALVRVVNPRALVREPDAAARGAAREPTND
jgi:multidrug efflux pump subunit AcrA (membrane-fusion protein)